MSSDDRKDRACPEPARNEESGGWFALHRERNQLRQERDQAREDLAHALASHKCESCEAGPPSTWCSDCIIEDYQASCGCAKCVVSDVPPSETPMRFATQTEAAALVELFDAAKLVSRRWGALATTEEWERLDKAIAAVETGSGGGA